MRLREEFFINKDSTRGSHRGGGAGLDLGDSFPWRALWNPLPITVAFSGRRPSAYVAAWVNPRFAWIAARQRWSAMAQSRPALERFFEQENAEITEVPEEHEFSASSAASCSKKPLVAAVLRWVLCLGKALKNLHGVLFKSHERGRTQRCR